MQPISYARHQFPAEIIRHATWLYLRFTLCYRDVEELLAERGIEVSYETVRRWVVKFGPAFARGQRSEKRTSAQPASSAGEDLGGLRWIAHPVLFIQEQVAGRGR
jgi:transposase-like protein